MNKDQFDLWYEHPGTKQFLKAIKTMKEIAEQTALSRMMTVEELPRLNKLLGVIENCKWILDRQSLQSHLSEESLL